MARDGRQVVGVGAEAHWETVYRARDPAGVSWLQSVPARSLELIQSTGLAATAPIIDVGGGASTLVDHLIASGYSDLTVLDIAPTALDHARHRLGPLAERVSWIAADVTRFVPNRRYGLWHDRAVFHFQTNPADRDRYLVALRAGLAEGGHLLLSTFGPDGPTRCSGLEVRRYSAAELQQVLGPGFRLERSLLDEHVTPTGQHQQFLYGWWRYRSDTREGR
jgi:SAM-dependent methyltransferase